MNLGLLIEERRYQFHLEYLPKVFQFFLFFPLTLFILYAIMEEELIINIINVMLEEYKKKTNTGVGLGILFHFVAGVLAGIWNNGDSTTLAIVAIVVGIVGTILFFWGLASYAKGKGYSGAFGLLGLFSLLGLIILVIMPDKNKTPQSQEQSQ